jgi:hypothetical protein
MHVLARLRPQCILLFLGTHLSAFFIKKEKKSLKYRVRATDRPRLNKQTTNKENKGAQNVPNTP